MPTKRWSTTWATKHREMERQGDEEEEAAGMAVSCSDWEENKRSQPLVKNQAAVKPATYSSRISTDLPLL
ncbi:hypothetical protein ACOSP7_028157 [Xanthoceras sorbifolium]